MRNVHVILGVLAVVAIVQSAATAQTAQTIINRCFAVYDTARTCQSTVTITMSESANSFTKTVITGKVENEPGGTGMMARQALLISTTVRDKQGSRTEITQIADDGKTYYSYYPAKNQYTKQLHAIDRFSNLFRSTIERVQRSKVQLIVATAIDRGRAVFVIRAPHPSGNALRILIDKANYQLKRIEFSDKQMKFRLAITDQILNAPLPASTFHWLPPKDAEEIPVQSDTPEPELTVG